MLFKKGEIVKNYIESIGNFLWRFTTRERRDFVLRRANKISEKFTNKKLSSKVFTLVFHWGCYITLGIYYVKWGIIKARYYRLKWAIKKYWGKFVYFLNCRPQHLRMFYALYKNWYRSNKSFKENFAVAMKYYKKYRGYGINNLMGLHSEWAYEVAHDEEMERRIDWGPDMYR